MVILIVVNKNLQQRHHLGAFIHVAVVIDGVAMCGDGGGRTCNLLVNEVSKVKEKEKKNIPGVRDASASRAPAHHLHPMISPSLAGPLLRSPASFAI